MSCCAVIPAAGRGTRLGADVPKILVPVGGGDVVWDVLAANLSPVVDQFQVVLSEAGLPLMREHLEARPAARPVELVVQAAPIGMGDATFTGSARWQGFDEILVCWGDQVNLHTATLQRALDAQRRLKAPGCTLPMVERDAPYVQYVFDQSNRLTAVREQREGDVCDPRGLSDVGVFVLSVSGLCDAWAAYLSSRRLGKQTGEVNLLPFFVYLSAAGWTVQRIGVDDPNEALGINTREELDAFVRQREARSRR